MEKSQIRVENSIQDVKEMIISRLGDQWKREWVEEVQGLLERDAGWGWKGFWECVKRNLDVRLFVLLPPFSRHVTVWSFLLSARSLVQPVNLTPFPSWP